MAIDWRALAEQVGDLDPGHRALELIIGEENIRGAVDHWASLEPGFETAEKTLLMIRSTVAMEYCYEIYKKEPNTERAGAALFLLAEMADRRFMQWARELMEDSNDRVRWSALVALGQALQGPLSDEETALAKELLIRAQTDRDPRLRERATEIRHWHASDPGMSDLEL